MKIKFQTLRKVHNYISVFFLPLALIIIITGALYTVGLHSTAERTRLEVQLNPKEYKDLNGLTKKVKQILTEHNLTIPDGEAKRMRNGYFWGKFTKKVVFLAPDRKSKKMQLTVHTPGIYDKLLLAHKGKVGTLFNIFLLIFSFSLIITYFSGVFMNLKHSKEKKRSLLLLFSGFFFTFLILIISLI